jgi:hypothetical protein
MKQVTNSERQIPIKVHGQKESNLKKVLNIKFHRFGTEDTWEGGHQEV